MIDPPHTKECAKFWVLVLSLIEPPCKACPDVLGEASNVTKTKRLYLGVSFCRGIFFAVVFLPGDQRAETGHCHFGRDVLRTRTSAASWTSCGAP